MHEQNRINIILYNSEPLFLSIGLDDGVDYYTYFDPDEKIQIPGGYGEYRIGAVGKLSSLQKDPDIFRKSFSSATSSFITLYLYSNEGKIYYGKLSEDKQLDKPTLGEFMAMQSNGSIMDKIYLYYLLSKRGDSLRQLKFSEADEFAKRYKGYFYSQPIRSERKIVQIQYSDKYRSASAISRILAGQGVNVSDISQMTFDNEKNCLIREKKGFEKHSESAIKIADFFHCDLQFGPTDLYDIIIILGKLEKSWEI